MVDRLKGTPKENQPEYAWEIEPDKHFLKVTHIGKDGRPFISDEKYTPDPKGYTVDILLHLMPGDRKLEVTPYRLQVFKNKPLLNQPSHEIDELLVGIVDGKSTAFLALKWTGDDGNQRINKFFFEDDKPAGCNLGFIQAPSWPLNRPVIITPAMMSYFSALGEITPDASQSLAKCAAALTVSGLEFTRGDTSMQFSLPRKT